MRGRRYSAVRRRRRSQGCAPVLNPPMMGSECAEILRELNLSPRDAATLLEVPPETLGSWIAGTERSSIPGAVRILLRLWRQYPGWVPRELHEEMPPPPRRDDKS